MIVRDTDSSGFQFRIIIVDDLNPEDVAMVQALKARSNESSVKALETIYASRKEAFKSAVYSIAGDLDNGAQDTPSEDLADALMAISAHNDASALARRFNQQWLVNYAHKSIADCGATTLIIEGVSMLAAKALENHPLFSGQETSTRAVDMTTVELVDPIGSDASRDIQRRCMNFYTSHWDEVADEVRRRYPRNEGETEKAYEGAVKYRTFDILRAWIPAGAKTHVSITMNLRQVGDHLTTLLLHPLAEVREVALVMQSMLRERYPSSGSFGAAAGVSGVGRDGKEAERDLWNRNVAHGWRGSAYQLARANHSTSPALITYRDTIDDAELANSAITIGSRPRGCVLPHWMSDFGQITCMFELDFGSYRDIHRHRNGVCRMPLLTTKLGFESWYINQLPERLQLIARDLYLSVWETCDDLPLIRRGDHDALCRAQYCVPMGFKVPVTVTYGLPAFIYVVELRSTPQVHPTLRRAVLKHMVAPFRAAHPEVLLHVDDSEDPWSLRRGMQTIERKS